MVSFVIITAKMKQPVQDKLLNFACEAQSILFCLSDRALNRNYDFAEV